MTDWVILNKLFHTDCLGFTVGRIEDLRLGLRFRSTKTKTTVEIIIRSQTHIKQPQRLVI